MVVTQALEEFQSHFIKWQGECNVPLIFLKEAKWFDQDGADGYYCQYEDEGWKHIEFSFKFLVWVNIQVKDQKYLVWQIAGGQLEITQEERSIPRSDWGPIDGAADPTSEPENIDIWEPQSNPSEGEKTDNKDIIIPTEASAQADKVLQVFFHTLKTDDLPPSIPRPLSRTTRIPSITATLMATTTQTTTHAPTIGCGGSGGGGGSGPSGSNGGGGSGGGPPSGGPPDGGGPLGGAAGPGPGQVGGGAKLVGNPPQIFDGNRERTQLFLSQWEIYWGLNYTVDIMAQPYTRVLCFLLYIQGEEVQDWVTHELMPLSTLWHRPKLDMNSVNSEWKEGTLMSTSPNSSDMSPQPDMESMNQQYWTSSSKDCQIPLPKPVWKWTHLRHGKNGKYQCTNARMYIYVGNRS